MEAGLKQKTISGMIWSFAQRFGVMLISFCANIVLARLLSPDDFGCIGMLMIFILIANTFIDGGFGSALIQKKQPTQDDYSTIFYWNLFISVILYVILLYLSPLIAKFYDIPLLSPVLRTQGLVLILNSFSVIQQNRLRKQLQFKKLAIINLISASASLLITIYLAYIGYGVWALVAQQLMISLFNAVLFWIIGKWWPSFVFSLRSFKELFSFGGFLLLSNLINTFCNNIQGLLIGKYFSPYTMGLYSQAKKLEEVASTSISCIVDQVSYPVLSEVQDDKEKLQKVLKGLTTSIAFFSFPIMLLLIVIAKPLIVLLYSERWVECVPYFQILCIAGLAISLQNINYYAVAAIGKSKSLFNWTLVKRVTSIILIVAGFCINGIYGLLCGMVIASYSIYLINSALASKYIGYTLRAQLRDLLPVISVSILSLLIPVAISFLLPSGLLNLTLTSLTYITTYLCLSKIFIKSKIAMLKEIIGSIIKRNSRHE